MKTYPFPGTEWQVSRLAYGCGGIGGAWDTTPLDDEWRGKAFAILDEAVEAGINFFDHADIYTHGKSEQVFGEYLAARPGLRDRIYLQSKCGIRFPNTSEAGDPSRYDFSKEHILASVEGSLRRLGTEYLDVLLLHRPDPLVEPEEVAEAFDELERAGKVRCFGVSNHTIQQVELLRRSVRQPLVVNQLELSLPHPDLVADGVYANSERPDFLGRPTGLLDYCRLEGMLVQAWSPLGGGAFYQAGAERAPHHETLREAIGALARTRDAAPEAVMLAWILRHPAGIQPIVGTLSPERLRKAATAVDLELTRTEWYGLLAAALGRNVP